jgi:hypothetical protein
VTDRTDSPGLGGDLPGIPPPRLPIRQAGPKGLAPYHPRDYSEAQLILVAAMQVVDDYRAQGRLPLGSREVGYILTRYGWTHDDIYYVEEVVERARRAGHIAWDAIADGRTSWDGPWRVDEPDEIVRVLLDDLTTAQLDRQADQAYRVEMWAEAAAWIARLAPQCSERGVEVYSGSGSVPVRAVRQAALRVLASKAPTVILWCGDLDVNGLRNIGTPFADDVRQMTIDLLAQQVVERREAGAQEAVATATRYVDLNYPLQVRRLLVTPDQVRDHVPESAWAVPTRKDVEAGWLWPFKVQAEALPPEARDEIVADALDSLLDAEVRGRVIADEADLHADARRRLRDALDEDDS